MPLHFAYGSNMDREAMAGRCPASRPLGIARLMRHRFFVTSDGYASVARDPRGAVWGLLWDVALADVPALDRYESLATGLYAKISQPVLTDAGARRALIYVARSRQSGEARPGYMERVLSAAAELGLPFDYRRELGRWIPQAHAETDAVLRPAVRPIWSTPTGPVGSPAAKRKESLSTLSPAVQDTTKPLDEDEPDRHTGPAHR